MYMILKLKENKDLLKTLTNLEQRIVRRTTKFDFISEILAILYLY